MTYRVSMVTYPADFTLVAAADAARSVAVYGSDEFHISSVR